MRVERWKGHPWMGQIFLHATVEARHALATLSTPDTKWWQAELPPIQKTEERWLIWLGMDLPVEGNLLSGIGWFRMTFGEIPTSIHTQLSRARGNFRDIPVYGAVARREDFRLRYMQDF